MCFKYCRCQICVPTRFLPSCCSSLLTVRVFMLSHNHVSEIRFSYSSGGRVAVANMEQTDGFGFACLSLKLFDTGVKLT